MCSKLILNIQLILISGFHNFSIGSVKKLMPNFFDKEKYVLHYEKLGLRLGLKLKNTLRIRTESIK